MTKMPQTYAHLSKKYSAPSVKFYCMRVLTSVVQIQIFYIWGPGVLGKDLIIINNYTVAVELFEKKGHIYSCW